ncbi:hypothetical protein OS189_11175 [Sulfitobacter sp. F26169L]|uniref:hypothetical protein n=1 Tax=Sulfitobacter sp. F26169L TaxID=2996015 RepID=UPI002260C913|nr:hypothetical protein [Sulfitobacter sp. F26169L]MCX7566901.1 hypothetical protein [Sulfitobacter sp. F26169L]
MTERTGKTEANTIDWRSFCIALVAAPLLACGVCLALLFALDVVYQSDELRGYMGVIAITSAIGVPFYLGIGTPMLIWHLRRKAPRIGAIVGLSLLSLLWLLPITAVVALFTGETSTFYLLPWTLVFGACIAPVWGGIFALLYRRLVRA